MWLLTQIIIELKCDRGVFVRTKNLLKRFIYEKLKNQNHT